MIKNCPTNIAVDGSCTVAAGWLFANVRLIGGNPVKTAGAKTINMKVSGGTPPNPPNKWNGLFVKEFRIVNPGGAGTGTAADFDVANFVAFRAAACTATAQGFVVATAEDALWTCARPAGDDKFWDDVTAFSTTPTLKAGKPAKTIICRHTYKCKNTPLDTGGALKAYKDTTTFTNGTFDPPGDPPAYRVTVCTDARVAE